MSHWYEKTLYAVGWVVLHLLKSEICRLCFGVLEACSATETGLCLRLRGLFCHGNRLLFEVKDLIKVCIWCLFFLVFLSDDGCPAIVFGGWFWSCSVNM